MTQRRGWQYTTARHCWGWEKGCWGCVLAVRGEEVLLGGRRAPVGDAVPWVATHDGSVLLAAGKRLLGVCASRPRRDGTV
jgi:hypothetical protein